MNTDDDSNLRESLIRLEAKIDVVLGNHDNKIDGLTSQGAEHRAMLREHDARITANALTIAEARAAMLSNAGDIKDLQSHISSQGNNIPTWVAVGVATLAVILGPILTALITHGALG